MGNTTLQAVLLDEISKMEQTPISEVLYNETGVTEEELFDAADASDEDGSAPVSEVPPQLAFAAGLLVGLRHSEWSDKG